MHARLRAVEPDIRYQQTYVKEVQKFGKEVEAISPVLPISNPILNPMKIRIIRMPPYPSTLQSRPMLDG
jgi:hypothetical protein